MKEKLVLAKGVTFESEPHKYYINGKELSGITKLIAKRMNIRMPEEFAGEARNEGLHIHSAVEQWLDGSEFPSIHPGAVWIKGILERQWHKPQEQCHSEVLVSDLKQFASSVDIVGVYPDGTVVLYDIKRSFKRVYVSWQLSIYQYFIEKYTKYRVAGLNCLSVKDRTMFPIFAHSKHDVEELLYGSK